jgi:ribosome-associated protein YbcJ (S4-like RNA binding protein)
MIHLHDVIKETDIDNRGANIKLDLNERCYYKDIS